MIRRIHLFGIEVLRVEADDETNEPGDCTTDAHPVGFVRDDLPSWHRIEED